MVDVADRGDIAIIFDAGVEDVLESAGGIPTVLCWPLLLALDLIDNVLRLELGVPRFDP